MVQAWFDVVFEGAPCHGLGYNLMDGSGIAQDGLGNGSS